MSGDASSVAPGERRAEVAANLADLTARIAAACRAAGRSPEELSLVAVTKTFPASDVRLLAELGITDVGENRDQEAAAKQAECRDLGLRWHFIGQLQTNKCRSVAEYADVVQSVDRPRLVGALEAAAARAERSLSVFIQVSLDGVGQDSVKDDTGAPNGVTDSGVAHRGGVTSVEVLALADQIAAAPRLSLAGVMAVAPLGASPDGPFDRLSRIARDLQAAHPHAVAISAGMSGDLESAVRHGATHLRVGSALLGRRSGVVG